MFGGNFKVSVELLKTFIQSDQTFNRKLPPQPNQTKKALNGRDYINTAVHNIY